MVSSTLSNFFGKQTLTSERSSLICTQITSHLSFTFVNDELRRKDKLVVGNNANTKLHILHWLHDSAIGGHSGRDATLQRVKSLFYWPRMNMEIQAYVRNCSVCQKNKNDLAAKPGLLQSLPVPNGVWESIGMGHLQVVNTASWLLSTG